MVNGSRGEGYGSGLAGFGTPWNKRKRILLAIPRSWIYDRTTENTCTTGLEKSLDREAR